MVEKGKVLIIEDEAEWQNYLRETLTEGGFYVEIAGDLESALPKIKNEMFHCITIDMRLSRIEDPSKLEGWKILEEVKRSRMDDRTVVIVITGFPKDYEHFHIPKNIQEIHMIDKGKFRKKDFLEIVNKEVEKNNLRFHNDHRTNSTP